METLFNHGNFIKFYTYMSMYIKSALPKSRASNLFTFAKYHYMHVVLLQIIVYLKALQHLVLCC